MEGSSRLPAGGDYAAYAIGAIQATYYLRAALARGGESVDGGKGYPVHMTQEQFTDSAALAFRSAVGSMGSRPQLSFTFGRETTGRSGEILEVRARDASGSGADIRVSPDFSVDIVAYQGTKSHGSVAIVSSEQTLRMNDGGRQGIPYLEYRSALTPARPFAPMPVTGDDRFVGEAFPQIRAAAENTGQTVAGTNPNASPERTMFPPTTLMTGAMRAGSDLFAVRDGLPQPLKNGYHQSGHITYNGFSMVEQSTGQGTVLYDRSQLEAHSRDVSNLERELERGATPSGSADLRVQGGQVIDGITRAHELNRARPGLQHPGHER